MIRWLLDGTRVVQLAGDNRIGRSTCYEYLHEALACWPNRHRVCTRR